MGLLRKKENDSEFSFETNDLLIVFNENNRTSDINFVSEVTEEAVTVDGLYKVPLGDCEITTGKDGRNFFYRAPAQSITETERLAQLEQSMVLNQITNYQPPVMPNSIDWVKGLLIGLIFIAFIVLAVIAA
ncbi:hypothetical protein [Virgibacillus sp. SK37]|uniref:hypothetical protein n=1 Tax=Virgibacillus sp. SK37 TaxID=403957 RepID=UPI0004D143F8|nr:hypothetical protein [Virgibacillus sp. SK37]AIF45732.1 hypothetical protein X953_19850 [Virgibacillus sp. SK37]